MDSWRITMQFRVCFHNLQNSFKTGEQWQQSHNRWDSGQLLPALCTFPAPNLGGRLSLPFSGKEISTNPKEFKGSAEPRGERNGNPIQYSCLENLRDRGSWWAAVCGVTQSRTWLMWLSNSSRNSSIAKGSHKHPRFLISMAQPTQFHIIPYYSEIKCAGYTWNHKGLLT